MHELLPSSAQSKKQQCAILLKQTLIIASACPGLKSMKKSNPQKVKGTMSFTIKS